MEAPAPRSSFSDRPEGPVPGIGSLGATLAEIESAPEIYRPTAFWSNRVEQHLEQLRDDGFAHFKRTINQNYFQFQFMSPFHPRTRGLWVAWLKHPRLAPMRVKLSGPADDLARGARFSGLGVGSYARYIALLADEVRCHDPEGRRVGTIVELGVGYGRLAWVWLMARPGIRYFVVDIPPALAVAEQNLTTLHPARKAFGFSRFTSEAEVADEQAAAKLAFFTPNRFDLLPGLRADLFVHVRSLYQMVQAQIDNLLRVIGEHTDGRFCSKQWIRSINARNGVKIKREDYPVPETWKPVFDREYAVNADFFEALYELPS